jgi:hypothetical protein
VGQTTDEITTHIENTRDNLGSNLEELEERVKAVTDWRQKFQASPMSMLGVAFGGGLVLALLMGGRRPLRSVTPPRQESERRRFAGSDHRLRRAFETWDNVQDALIGVAATRLKGFVGDLVPGFREELQRTEQRAAAAQGGVT